MIDKEGLRPTPDRVRETVFNWLAMDIPRARVLDCFAGAGGLGLEAASREASEVIMVDKDRQVTQSLQQQVERLKAGNITVVCADIMTFLDDQTEPFDVVFIDPPYQLSELRNDVITALLERDLLNNDAKLYVEWPNQQQMTLYHENLSWIKQKNAASVCYALAKWGECR